MSYPVFQKLFSRSVKGMVSCFQLFYLAFQTQLWFSLKAVTSSYTSWHPPLCAGFQCQNQEHCNETTSKTFPFRRMNCFFPLLKSMSLHIQIFTLMGQGLPVRHANNCRSSKFKNQMVKDKPKNIDWVLRQGSVTSNFLISFVLLDNKVIILFIETMGK